VKAIVFHGRPVQGETAPSFLPGCSNCRLSQGMSCSVKSRRLGKSGFEPARGGAPIEAVLGVKELKFS
jgi:hypothetical protein